MYNEIKRSAKKASRKHLDLGLDQLRWLEELPGSGTLVADIPATKLKHLADRAAVLDAGDMKDFKPGRAAFHKIFRQIMTRMNIFVSLPLAMLEKKVLSH